MGSAEKSYCNIETIVDTINGMDDTHAADDECDLHEYLEKDFPTAFMTVSGKIYLSFFPCMYVLITV